MIFFVCLYSHFSKHRRFFNIEACSDELPRPHMIFHSLYSFKLMTSATDAQYKYVLVSLQIWRYFATVFMLRRYHLLSLLHSLLFTKYIILTYEDYVGLSRKGMALSGCMFPGVFCSFSFPPPQRLLKT